MLSNSIAAQTALSSCVAAREEMNRRTKRKKKKKKPRWHTLAQCNAVWRDEETDQSRAEYIPAPHGVEVNNDLLARADKLVELCSGLDLPDHCEYVCVVWKCLFGWEVCL